MNNVQLITQVQKQKVQKLRAKTEKALFKFAAVRWLAERWFVLFTLSFANKHHIATLDKNRHFSILRLAQIKMRCNYRSINELAKMRPFRSTIIRPSRSLPARANFHPSLRTHWNGCIRLSVWTCSLDRGICVTSRLVTKFQIRIGPSSPGHRINCFSGHTLILVLLFALRCSSNDETIRFGIRKSVTPKKCLIPLQAIW